MEIQNLELHATHAVERLPSFSLGTAMAWLGHECDGTCPTQIADARAKTWRLSPPLDGGSTWMRALLDVEFTDPSWSSEQGLAMMSEVNQCISGDRIFVQERSAAERFAIEAMTSWLSGFALL